MSLVLSRFSLSLSALHPELCYFGSDDDGDDYQNMLDLLPIPRLMGIALPGPSGQGYWATPSG